MAKRADDRIELPASFDVDPEDIADDISEETPDETPPTPREFQRVRARRPMWTMVTGGVFVVLLVVAYALVPPQPRLWQLLAATFYSLLAGLVVHFAFDEYGRRYKRIKFPRIAGKKIKPKRPGTLVGWATVALVFSWWMTPLAPIRVYYITAADLLAEFTAEVTQATLIQPHEHLAVLQRPVPPRSALAAAADIPEDADAFRLALRALAQGESSDFQEARKYLDQAVPGGKVTEAMIRQARPLIDLYDGKYLAAAEGYEKAMALEPKDFQLACQTAAALAHAQRLAEAETLADDLRSRASSDPEKITAINLLAAVYILEGKLQEARRLWADPLIQEAAKEASAGARNNQGVLSAMLANYDRAELKYSSAIRVWRERWDKTRWEKVNVEIHVGPGLLNRGVGFYGIGKFKDAEKHLRDVMEEKFRDLPNDHSAKGVAAAALAMLYLAEGRFEKVDSLVEQASTPFDTSTENHTLATRYLTARLAAARGRYAEAMLVLRSLLTDIGDRLSSNHPLAAEVLHQMAVIRMLQAEYAAAVGNTQRAEDDLQNAAKDCGRAIKIIERYSKSPSLSHRHWAADRVRTTLGRIHFRQKKTGAAAAGLRLALSQLQTVLGEKHLAIADVLAAQAEAQSGSKAKFKFNDAINMVLEVLGNDGEKHPRVARWRFRIASIDFATGDADKAKANIDKAIEMQAEKQPRHPHYAESLRLHAEILRKIDADDPAAAETDARAAEVRENHNADETAAAQGG